MFEIVGQRDVNHSPEGTVTSPVRLFREASMSNATIPPNDLREALYNSVMFGERVRL